MRQWNSEIPGTYEINITHYLDGLFRKKFGENEQRIIVRSPGRVNLIGEHTDYNEGYVLPAAIDRAIMFSVARRKDTRCRFFASDLNEEYESDLEKLSNSDRRWPNYLLGVVDQLHRAGYAVPGFDCVFGGDIPIGAGLSSSAAIEGGLMFALNELFELGIDKLTLARLAQRAENEFVGVQCGIMDQFINMFGEENTVMKLDCRSLEYERYPFERDDLRILLCETQVRRDLASSEYNIRRKQCEKGVDVLRRNHPDIRSLRDVTTELLDEHAKEMDPIVARRCDFVVKENARVLKACEDLRGNDFSSFGQRMYESHQGLRFDYEVSSYELDLLVDTASRMEGVLGARMMGAGFGGCTINIVEEPFVSQFTASMRDHYRSNIAKELKVHVCSIKAGTAIIK